MTDLDRRHAIDLSQYSSTNLLLRYSSSLTLTCAKRHIPVATASLRMSLTFEVFEVDFAVSPKTFLRTVCFSFSLAVKSGQTQALDYQEWLLEIQTRSAVLCEFALPSASLSSGKPQKGRNVQNMPQVPPLSVFVCLHKTQIRNSYEWSVGLFPETFLSKSQKTDLR